MSIIESYFIQGLITVLVLILLIQRFWKPIKLKVSLQIIRFGILLYGVSLLFFVVFSLLGLKISGNEFNDYLTRSIPLYATMYLVHIILSVVLSLLLLIPKLGLNIYFLLITSIILNYGNIMIFISNQQVSYYYGAGLIFPNSIWKGIVITLMLVPLEIVITRFKSYSKQ
jgi:hypothetical protein